MIPQFAAFFTLFRQGKELTNAASWKNKTIAVNSLVSMLGAALVVARGFGYDISIDDQTIQTAGAGIFALYCAGNAIMHVITSKKVGLPPHSKAGPSDRTEPTPRVDSADYRGGQ